MHTYDPSKKDKQKLAVEVHKEYKNQMHGRIIAGAKADPQIKEAVEKMKHRGTQSPTIHNFSNCSVGHIRLPIINLTNGLQPFSDQEGETWLVGEVFNYKEFYPKIKESIKNTLHAFWLKLYKSGT